MDKKYYYAKGTEQIGPVSLEELRGVINPDTLIWYAGISEWKPASQIPELTQLINIPTVNASVVESNYQSNINQAKPPKPNNNKILAVISIFFCQVLGIIALVYALQSDSEYNVGNYAVAEKKAKTAKTLGLIGIAGGAILIFIYVLYFILVITGYGH